MDLSRSFPPPPVFDVGRAGPIALLDLAPDRALRLAASALDRYGRATVRFGDAVSRRWLERARNPYLADVNEVARHLGRSGAYLLNLSHEWACTTGVGPDPDGPGARMLRTLDWDMAGLGRELVVARCATPAGDYLSATWPGFVGVTTAMAPGRFALAFNQTPLPRSWRPMPFDWLRQKRHLWRCRALPPAHLLRRVCETCEDYAQARAMLCETPIALPAFFSLTGTRGDEACVIERLPERAFVHEGPVVVGNHWLTPGMTGKPPGENSVGRAAAMRETLSRSWHGLDWLRPPVLCRTTRVAFTADAASGRLWVAGVEGEALATSVLALTQAPGEGASAAVLAP